MSSSPSDGSVTPSPERSARAAPDDGGTAAPGARPAALLAVRIGPDDIGARVSVRHRLHGDPAASLTDVVGVLLSWAPGAGGDAELRIERRDGTVATVPEADLVAARTVPPPRPHPSR